MPYTGERISLQLTLYIDPAQTATFLSALEPVYDAVVAEPECTLFEIFQSPTEPGVFRLLECFDADQKWMHEVGRAQRISKGATQDIMKHRINLVCYDIDVEIHTGTSKKAILQALPGNSHTDVHKAEGRGVVYKNAREQVGHCQAWPCN